MGEGSDVGLVSADVSALKSPDLLALPSSPVPFFVSNSVPLLILVGGSLLTSATVMVVV